MADLSDCVIRKDDIVEGLKAVGLEPGCAVIVHSALSSFGTVEGGADTVIDALLEVVGKEGTVMMPEFTLEEPFNLKTSPTYLGAVSEVFRKRKQALRSLNPLSSVSAIGKEAEYLVEGHVSCQVPQGMESPFGKLIELGGYVLLLGVDFDRCTVMHMFEILSNAPYLSEETGEYLDHDGRKVRRTYRQFPGPHRDFIGLTSRFENAGIIKKTKIGGSVVRLMKAKDLIAEGLKAMEEDPAAVLCENPNCADCIEQRSKIYREQLGRENFKLAAVSDLAGRYVDEIVENLLRYGIQYVEIYHLQGRELFELEPEEVDYVFQRFDKLGISVSGIKVSHISYFDIVEKIASKYHVRQIILPMSANTSAKRASEGEPAILLENVNQLAAEVCEILRKNRGKNLALAFNPFNFARVKEQPFMTSLTKGRVKKYIRQLYINDGTFDGLRTEPASGNAEIKELVSILRYSSFDGYFVLEGHFGKAGGFHSAVKGFWRLLKEM